MSPDWPGHGARCALLLLLVGTIASGRAGEPRWRPLPNLGWKAQVDALGQGEDGSERWGTLLGWNSANGADLEVRFPEPVERKSLSSLGGFLEAGKPLSITCPGCILTLGLSRGGRPLPADSRVLFVPTIFIEQLLVYLWGAAKMRLEGCLSPPAFQTVC